MHAEATILVFSGKMDDPQSLARLLADHYRIVESDHPDDFLDQLSDAIDIVVFDLSSAKAESLELLSKVKGAKVIVIATEGDVDGAVNAIKRGASDCIEKPVDRERLLSSISKLLHERSPSDDAGDGTSDRQDPRSQIDIPPGTSLEELERAAVEQALIQHQGNRTHAAKTLGISVRTLQRKLKAWGIPIVTAPHASQPPSRNFIFPTHSADHHSAYSTQVH